MIKYFSGGNRHWYSRSNNNQSRYISAAGFGTLLMNLTGPEGHKKNCITFSMNSEYSYYCGGKNSDCNMDSVWFRCEFPAKSLHCARIAWANGISAFLFHIHIEISRSTVLKHDRPPSHLIFFLKDLAFTSRWVWRRSIFGLRTFGQKKKTTAAATQKLA